MRNEYIAPLLKWWWLLLIAMITAGVSAYFTTRPLPYTYEARTTLVIGRFISNPNPTQDEMVLSQQLAQTYADIARREPVRDATKKALGLSDLPLYTARPLANGPFLEIAVDYSDPKIAQAVANELANQLTTMTPASVKQSEVDTQVFIEGQLKDVQAKINKTQEEITAKQNDLSTLNNAVLINQAQTELDALDTRLTSLRSIYSNMVSSMPQNARNQLSVYESADLPRIPIGPNKTLIIALAALGGLVIAALAAYAIEAMDSTIKNAEEASKLLDLPVVGRVSTMGGSKKSATYVIDQPNSPVADDFRLLRTNLEFFGVDQPIKTYMVSSPNIGDGKSTVASNLAMVMAMGEKSVILVDADFRRPVLGDALGMGIQVGLSDALSHSLPVEEVLLPFPGNPQLRILMAGTIPPNPTELLSSNRMERVLEDLKTLADVIIIDGPPFLVADASVLASRVDGVVLVVRSGHSYRAAVTAMYEQTKRMGANVLGLVMNQTPGRSAYYTSNYNSRKIKTLPDGPTDTHIDLNEASGD